MWEQGNILNNNSVILFSVLQKQRSQLQANIERKQFIIIIIIIIIQFLIHLFTCLLNSEKANY
jgi:hypothetical protein